MRTRAFTLVEVMVVSSILLIMLVMTTMGVMSYMRAYRHYIHESMKLRLASKTLEAVCRELRSARCLDGSVPASLKAGPLRFRDDSGELVALQLVGHSLVVQRGEVQVKLGQALDLEVSSKQRLLELRIPVEGQAPVQTAVMLRGRP